MAENQLDVTAASEEPQLLIAGADGAAFQVLEALFVSATPAPVFTVCDRLEDALAQDNTAPVVIPVSPPLDVLREALQSGAAPKDALADWRAGAEALLQTCRRARSRVLLIDAAMLETRPDACARALGERLGLRFGEMPPPGGSEAGRSATHAVIAASLLAGDVKALDLIDELEAMTLGPVSPRSPARAEIASAAEAAASLADGNNQLRENLAKMLAQTEELRAALIRNEEEAQALTKHGTRIDELEDRLAEAEADRDMVVGERDLLVEERDMLAGKRDLLAKERDLLAKERDVLVGERDQLIGERDLLIEERDLLRETLAQMVAEIERLLGEEGDLKRRLAARDADLRDKHLLEARLDDVSRQRDAAIQKQRWRDAVLGGEILTLAATARDERIALSGEIEDLRAGIERIRNSTSWKLTAPLRATGLGRRRT